MKKNDILIKENEIIEEIYFVIEGRLSLEIPINMDNPQESTNKYLSEEFLDFAFDFDYDANNYNPLPQVSNVGGSNFMDTDIKSAKRNKFLSSLIVKEPKKTFENNIYLKIHDIHKSEDFGDLYMFFGRRSPFALKAKTNRVKLYSIKKPNFENLIEQFQNVFRRIHRRKKHNLKIIKNIFIKTLGKFCDSRGIKIKEEFKDVVIKAIKQLQRQNIPDILKNKINKNEMSEIDEEINKTIKEFDRECISSGIHSKKIENLSKFQTVTDENKHKQRRDSNLYKGKKMLVTTINNRFTPSFLENFNLTGTNNKHNFTESINKGMKSKFKKDKNLIYKTKEKKYKFKN